MEFIVQNIGTIVVAFVVAAIVGAIVFNSLRKKKQGKASCSCGCANCPMKNKCH